MAASRVALVALALLTAVVVQTALVARLNLAFGRPDLILLVVAAIALAAGSWAGMLAGFAGGLLADLVSDHPVGTLALVLCLIGYGCGLVPATRRRGVVLPLSTVALAAVAATLGFAVLLALIANPRLDWGVVGGSLPGSVIYDVILAVFVVPAVAALHRRLNPAER